ncbi:YceI family protein [Acidobacteria bacterium AH-259-O06]|nr:YceI family protein [Acidobacteria bacterium AH-259-O06]
MPKRMFTAIVLSIMLQSSLLVADHTYKVDPVHSTVLFKAKRFDVVNVYGRFNGLQGTLIIDDENPAASSVELEIKAEAVDTNNERRDNHLRSPDFLNATQFPRISFKSVKIDKLEGNRYEVSGDLSLHGVTQSIVVEVEHVGSAQHPRRGTPLIGFETTFTIKRSDFGMNFMLPALSDEIQLIIAVHGMAP